MAYGLYTTDGPAAIFKSSDAVEAAVRSLRFISTCGRFHSKSVGFGSGRTLTMQGTDGEHTITKKDVARYGL